VLGRLAEVPGVEEEFVRQARQGLVVALGIGGRVVAVGLVQRRAKRTPWFPLLTQQGRSIQLVAAEDIGSLEEA